MKKDGIQTRKRKPKANTAPQPNTAIAQATAIQEGKPAASKYTNRDWVPPDCGLQFAILLVESLYNGVNGRRGIVLIARH